MLLGVLLLENINGGNMAKSKIVGFTLLGLIAIIVVLALCGRTLFAFFFLPLYSDVWITIPEGKYVHWDELRESPAYIEENAYWFSNCFVGWQIQQLERYMEKNDVCIAPGMYFFDTCRYGDALINSFDYVDADSISNEQ